MKRRRHHVCSKKFVQHAGRRWSWRGLCCKFGPKKAKKFWRGHRKLLACSACKRKG